MSKLETIESKKVLISAFPPLEIQLGSEGYLLKRKESTIKSYLIDLIFISLLLVIPGLLLCAFLPLFGRFSIIILSIFYLIYRPLKLILDESAGYKQGNELGGEGYLLKREISRIKYYLTDLTFIGISLLLAVTVLFSGDRFTHVPFLIILLPMFYVAYRLLKLTLDESTRYKQRTELSFMGVDLIFSHYPLKVGKNDRITFRLIWTVISLFVAAFPWMVLTVLFSIFFQFFCASVLGIYDFSPAFFIIPILLFVPIFFVVYRVLKLLLDKSARYKMGTDLGFAGAELIFSRYPLKVGENDRVTFRRRLKKNYWTNLFKIKKFPVNSHIKVNLLCVERTAYRFYNREKECWETLTDVAVLYEKIIYSDNLFCGDREVIGHFNLEIPPHLSPSLEWKRNDMLPYEFASDQIRWILDIEESYPGLLEQKHTYLTFVVDPSATIPNIQPTPLQTALLSRITPFLPPLEIQLGGEGYLLKEKSKEYTIEDYLSGFIVTSLFLVIPGLFLGSFLGNLFPNPYISIIFIPFFSTFFVVYIVQKLILDKSARYKMVTDLGFVGEELIFSHYPLKVGENDRVTFRRRLKKNYWTNLFKINKFPVDNHIKINLVCAERVSHTEGTETIADVAVVYQKMIYSGNLLCGDREVIVHFDLEIPLSCRSSVEGEDHQIRWILDIEESYPGLLEQKHTYLTFVVDP
jgi:hypothetical protein